MEIIQLLNPLLNQLIRTLRFILLGQKIWLMLTFSESDSIQDLVSQLNFQSRSSRVSEASSVPSNGDESSEQNRNQLESYRVRSSSSSRLLGRRTCLRRSRKFRIFRILNLDSDLAFRFSSWESQHCWVNTVNAIHRVIPKMFRKVKVWESCKSFLQFYPVPPGEQAYWINQISSQRSSPKLLQLIGFHSHFEIRCILWENFSRWRSSPRGSHSGLHISNWSNDEIAFKLCTSFQAF